MSLPVERSALKLLDSQQRKQVVAVAFSTDPQGDTPASVEEFLRRHDAADGQIRYLVAPVDDMRPVWDAFQILPSLDTGDDTLHSAPVRLYDRDGTWVATQHAGADLTPSNLAHDIRELLRQD
jgi:cytochrome oxidase Cu insertion factor (SCO1/SenC/PrrC family)